MEISPLESPKPASGTDYAAMHVEAWRDVFAAKIGLAQMLVLDVVFRYSLRVGRASAWIPSWGVFEMHTGMGKKEVGEALDDLVSFGMLEREDAPAVDLLPQGQFPKAQRYMYFPRGVRQWSIAPRVTSSRLLERAAIIDQWLPAFNAGGDPAQSELFRPLWEHADTLAEWSARSDDPPQVRPDLLPKQSEQPHDFRPGSAETLNHGEADRGEKPHGVVEKPWGKTPRREKPHGSINRGIELIGRQVSPLTQSKINADTVGKNPTPSELALEEDACRKSHWPTREVENRLMQRLGRMMARFYAPQMAVVEMQERGGLWRWRIREWSFAVEQAMDVTEAQWKEVHKLGPFLNREWKKIWSRRAAKQEAEIEAAAAAAAAPVADTSAGVQAQIAASLAHGEEIAP